MSKLIQKENNDVKYLNTNLIPSKIVATEQKKILRKPSWIRIKLLNDKINVHGVKAIMRKNGLYSVCEEASCPNLTECFNHGTATFMILGNICTRRCPFCNITHGRPGVINDKEPEILAQTISDMKLKYVVVTSVDRDDLKDGGAQHFSRCITAIRAKNPDIRIEILVPDFRGCVDRALEIINATPPDIFNHNIESVPRLYDKICPGANYYLSLKLLKKFKDVNHNLPTKSGLMMGLGETNAEIINVMYDLRNHGVNMLTIGQYLQPSTHHLPVKRYVSPHEFDEIKQKALDMGFTHVACGPLVRSSYRADLQAKGIEVK